jgi:hypothetical protein
MPDEDFAQKLLQLKTLLDDPTVKQLAMGMLNPKVASVYRSNQVAGKTGESKMSSPNGAYGQHSYYCKEFALRLKPSIDRMMANQKPIIFYYRRYPNRKPATIRQMFQQAFHYLCDHMDTPEGLYMDFRQKVQITQEVTGVVICYKKGFGPASDLMPFTSDELENAPSSDWTDLLKEFLAVSSQGESFTQKGFMFSRTEIQVIHREVDAANTRSDTSFLIKRLDPDYLEVINISGMDDDPNFTPPTPESKTYAADTE